MSGKMKGKLERAYRKNNFVVISNGYNETGQQRWLKPLKSAYMVEPNHNNHLAKVNIAEKN